MTTQRTLSRLHSLIWTLIYGGLLTLIAGLATVRSDEAIGYGMVVLGAVLAAAGVVLIWVRSRLRADD